MDHPFLSKPDRRRAYEDLSQQSTGTRREWAARWGWTEARVQRFLATLQREGIATVTPTAFGTRVALRPIQDRSKTDPPSGPPTSTEESSADPHPIQERSAGNPGPIRLGSKTGFTTGLVSRPIESEGEKAPDDYLAVCIDIVNKQLSPIYPDWFVPLRTNSPASARAVAKWRAAGVELEFAVEELGKSCRRFNPSKHGKGRPPGTLAYFERSVLRAHAARHQTGLPLPPVLQRGGARREPHRAKSQPVPVSVAIPAAIEVDRRNFSEAFEEGRRAGAGGRLR